MPWFGLLLGLHVALAISLLLPSVLLPFVLGRIEGRSGADPRPAWPLRWLLALQGPGSVAIAVGLALTGSGLLAILGPGLVTRPWLAVALGIYAANLLVAAIVARPNLRRLLRVRRGDDGAWERRARRQRLVAYAMAGATGVIGFLMSAKPELW
jgi:hypothetical protein